LNTLSEEPGDGDLLLKASPTLPVVLAVLGHQFPSIPWTPDGLLEVEEVLSDDQAETDDSEESSFAADTAWIVLRHSERIHVATLHNRCCEIFFAEQIFGSVRSVVAATDPSECIDQLFHLVAGRSLLDETFDEFSGENQDGESEVLDDFSSSDWSTPIGILPFTLDTDGGRLIEGWIGSISTSALNDSGSTRDSEPAPIPLFSLVMRSRGRELSLECAASVADTSSPITESSPLAVMRFLATALKVAGRLAGLDEGSWFNEPWLRAPEGVGLRALQEDLPAEQRLEELYFGTDLPESPEPAAGAISDSESKLLTAAKGIASAGDSEDRVDDTGLDDEAILHSLGKEEERLTALLSSLDPKGLDDKAVGD
jgi:hypothetical protein